MSRSVWCSQLGKLWAEKDMQQRFKCRCASFSKGSHQIVGQLLKAMPTLARNVALQ